MRKRPFEHSSIFDFTDVLFKILFAAFSTEGFFFRQSCWTIRRCRITQIQLFNLMRLISSHKPVKSLTQVQIQSTLFFPPWVVLSTHPLSDHLVWQKETESTFCQGLMVSLPSQMVIEWDFHKSGPGSPAASVWGQPHYKQSGSLPGRGDVPVHGRQHRRSDRQQEGATTVCLWVSVVECVCWLDVYLELLLHTRLGEGYLQYLSACCNV